MIRTGSTLATLFAAAMIGTPAAFMVGCEDTQDGDLQQDQQQQDGQGAGGMDTGTEPGTGGTGDMDTGTEPGTTGGAGATDGAGEAGQEDQGGVQDGAGGAGTPGIMDDPYQDADLDEQNQDQNQ